MAAARFQVVTVARHGGIPALRRPVRGSAFERRKVIEPSTSTTRTFTWRFLAANNRRLATAATSFGQVQECLESIRALQKGLSRAVMVLVQESPGRWVWRLRIDGTEQAVSHQGYPRRVRARLACESFLALIPGTRAVTELHVLHR